MGFWLVFFVLEFLYGLLLGNGGADSFVFIFGLLVGNGLLCVFLVLVGGEWFV